MHLPLIARPGLAKTSFMPSTSADATPALRSPAVQKLLQTPKQPLPETVVTVEGSATAWAASPTWGTAAAGRHRLVETVLMVGLFGYFAVGGLMALLH